MTVVVVLQDAVGNIVEVDYDTETRTRYGEPLTMTDVIKELLDIKVIKYDDVYYYLGENFGYKLMRAYEQK